MVPMSSFLANLFGAGVGDIVSIHGYPIRRLVNSFQWSHEEKFQGFQAFSRNLV